MQTLCEYANIKGKAKGKCIFQKVLDKLEITQVLEKLRVHKELYVGCQRVF